MKARMPFYMNTTREDRRKNAVCAQLLLFKFTLHRLYGWGRGRCMVFDTQMDEAIIEVAEYEHHNSRNKTWRDELTYWAEQQDFNIPDEAHYKLFIDGVGMMRRDQRNLLLMELFVLQRRCGFGPKRMQDLLTAYDEVSHLRSNGVAVYSYSALRGWADAHNIDYPGCADERQRREVNYIEQRPTNRHRNREQP